MGDSLPQGGDRDIDSNRSSESKGVDSEVWGCLFSGVLGLALLAWLVLTFHILPRERLTSGELGRLATATTCVRSVFCTWLPLSASVRIEPRGGSNLLAYLAKTDFETVPYPDRDDFVADVGQAWCENTGPDSHWFIPSVEIRDITAGDVLGHYNCVFSAWWSEPKLQPGDINLSGLRMTLYPGISTQKLSGPVYNSSGRYTVLALFVGISVTRPGLLHPVVPETEVKLEVTVPPHQSRAIEESVMFAPQLPSTPDLRWTVRILFVRSKL